MRQNVLHHLTLLQAKNLPFLALRLASENEVIIMSQDDNKLHKSAPDNVSYAVFSKFQNNDNQVFIKCDVIKKFNWNNEVFEVSNDPLLVSKKAQSSYLQLVEKALAKLRNKELVKVVLSRKQHTKNNVKPTVLYSRLLDTYHTANCYFFSHPQVGTWLGATPEVLASVENGMLTTMSLAGTAVYNAKQKHVWGKKELEEQQLVTDFIMHTLHVAGVKNLTQSAVETVLAGKLIHLRTLISGSITIDHVANVVSQLHPTPAICGIPTSKAMQFIVENENYDRSFYTGYLGVVEPLANKASYFVNLRCMELVGDEAVVYVGGGITAQSNTKLELQETINKSLTMYGLLK